jgi:mannose-6-phosphate isomerase-like protein (cupin superfamily)
MAISVKKSEIWRQNGIQSCITDLLPGTAIDIPLGTVFQYCNISNEDLKFIFIAMLPWPGDAEVIHVEGVWQPTT